MYLHDRISLGKEVESFTVLPLQVFLEIRVAQFVSLLVFAVLWEILLDGVVS